MNLSKLSFFLMLVAAITFTSCGDDDGEMTCTSSDWVGTYVGTQNCDGFIEDVTVTITAGTADSIVIAYETVTTESDFSPFLPNGCDINKTETGELGGAEFTLAVDAELDGDTLRFQDVITYIETATCDITATRN